ncbi:hypothetical protein KSP35_20790 [Aquihabitans sp. G128]|uniref:hypothetical protein n=1 Tax=Aquihabitans sp. G128 TaxID=2849779 RepID=UPI001C250244|nr:hypothetical protein [Aquihabitans sp. G128]QXC60730.1 hypothetical protein KSP35_20790 [Aquihabitans sp. G128]
MPSPALRIALRTAFAVALVAVVASFGLVVGPPAPPASASCAGPSVEVTPTRVDRGDLVTITGEAWGTDCYDTGGRPKGQGVLGVPATEIVVSFRQADRDVVVAKGDADRRYRFRVRVRVPGDVLPGTLDVVASARTGPDRYEVTAPEPLHLSQAAVPDRPAKPVPFGPRAEGGQQTPVSTAPAGGSTDPGASATTGSDDDPPYLFIGATVVVALVLAVGSLRTLRRIRRRDPLT